MSSRQAGRSVDTIVLSEASVKLSLLKRFRLWRWKDHNRKQMVKWILENDEEEE